MKNILHRLLLLGLLALYPLTSIAQPKQEPIVEVRGRLIDIREAKAGEEAYPQYKRHRFGRSLPESYAGMKYAVSLREFAGPKALRAKRPCVVHLAISGAVPTIG